MCEMTCLHATMSVRVAVMSLPAPLAIKGSARNRETDRAGHAKNRPIPITGRSLGASLIIRLVLFRKTFLTVSICKNIKS